MENYEILAVDHVCIFTDKVDETKELYAKYLGFEVAGDASGPGGREVKLHKGDFHLDVFSQKNQPEPGPVDHICLLVKGLDALVETLRAAGCRIEEGDPNRYNKDGILLCKLAYVRGLAGERIELYEKIRPDLYEKKA